MVPSLLSRLRMAAPSSPLPLHHLSRSLCSPTPSPPLPTNSKLFVAGLSWSADERSLKDAFSSFGTVTEGTITHTCNPSYKMSLRDVVAYSATIYHHARNGFFSESVNLLIDMLRLGICANSFTLVGVLLASAGLGDPRLTESIHGRVVKCGLESNPFVGTAMLDTYAKCGCPTQAWSLFGEMQEPGFVTWNAMITGFVQNNLFEEALLMFKRMLCLFGPVFNSVTMISVAQSCAGYGAIGLCDMAQAIVIKTGLDLNVSVMNSILSMYLSFQNLELGRVVLQKMVVTDVITWTTMMNFLLEHVRAEEVLSLFVKMRSNCIEPDRVAMVSLVQACALLGDARRGKLVHNQIIVSGFGTELPAVNSLITMYSKYGDLRSARMLFDSTKGKSLVSWTAMVSGYVESGSAIEGMHLFSKMRSKGKFIVDSVMMVTLLIACYKLAKFELCALLHADSCKLGLYMSRPVHNTLIAVYGKCGCVILARKVFDEMISRDVVSWNAIVLSYGINGKGEEAVRLLYEMEKLGEVADSVTYLNTLLACSHSGLVDDGLIIFRRMVSEKGINPSREHLGCMVDMLARAGRLEEAKKMVSFTQDDARQNAWKAWLGGCHLHGHMELTKAAAEKILGMETYDFGHVVLLSNSYASLGKFDVAESLRSSSMRKFAKKTLGLSSLDVMPSSAR